MKSSLNWFKEVPFMGIFFISSVLVTPTHASKTNSPHSPDLKVSKCQQAFGDFEEKIVISYGDPFNYTLENGVSWEIINSETEILYKEGVGNLNGIVFLTPGNYALHISEKMEHSETECSHLHFPDKIHIEVRPYKMVFDLSTVKFSKDLKGNQSVNGTTLTVDVIFSSWEGKTAVYEENLKTSGVRTSITGKLKKGPILLQQGKNTLEFQLEGQASNNTYISIDFIDINGQIQSYSFTNKII